MACMEHTCQACGHEWFDNCHGYACPKCGSTRIQSFYDEPDDYDDADNYFDDPHNDEDTDE